MKSEKLVVPADESRSGASRQREVAKLFQNRYIGANIYEMQKLLAIISSNFIRP
jgi:hypothetical protein